MSLSSKIDQLISIVEKEIPSSNAKTNLQRKEAAANKQANEIILFEDEEKGQVGIAEIKLLKCEKINWNWQSMNQMANDVRRVHSKLKKIETYERGICLFLSMVVFLFENVAKKHKIESKNLTAVDPNDLSFHTIRDLLFGDIVTIGAPFNSKTNTIYQRTLKMSHAKYKEFFSVISSLNKKNRTTVARYTYKHETRNNGNEDPNMIETTLFSQKQSKSLRQLTKLVLNYNAEVPIDHIKSQEFYSNHRKEMETMYENNNNNNNNNNGELTLANLTKCLSDTRRARCDFVLSHRTDSVIVILDGCYDCHNHFAMLRTCELFGVQSVWIIRPVEYKNINIINKISRNADQWLTIKYFDSSVDCLNYIKECNDKYNQFSNFKLWVTDVCKEALCLDLNGISKIQDSKNNLLPENLFIVMGRETDGASKEFLDNCDLKVYLPQYGFGDSFNVSVACALILEKIFFIIKPSLHGNFKNEKEKLKLQYIWYYQLAKSNDLKKKFEDYMKQSSRYDKNTIVNGKSKHEATTKDKGSIASKIGLTNAQLHHSINLLLDNDETVENESSIAKIEPNTDGRRNVKQSNQHSKKLNQQYRNKVFDQQRNDA